MIPPALLEVPDSTGSGRWRVRGFSSKYAALDLEGSQPVASEGPLFLSAPGMGSHEVLVETPEHNRFPSMRDEDEMFVLVQSYQQRYVDLVKRTSNRYVLVFKNHGEHAGTSLEHPHSQVIAAPVVPGKVQRTLEIAAEHFRRTGRCLQCRQAEEEIRLERRILFQRDGFVAFNPFASAHAAETWIVPTQHQPSFADLNEDGLAGFASALLRTLRQLSEGFDDPDFNYAIHSAFRGDECKPYVHWYLQLIPRLSTAAGFELGSGIYINPLPPEDAARAMRR